MARDYYVYILSSHSRAIYVGVTNDLRLRLWRHRNGEGSAFARRYHVSKLVYYEITGSPYAAVSREKEIKAWRRAKKVALIESVNGDWRDLAVDWDIGAEVRSRPGG